MTETEQEIIPSGRTDTSAPGLFPEQELNGLSQDSLPDTSNAVPLPAIPKKVPLVFSDQDPLPHRDGEEAPQPQRKYESMPRRQTVHLNPQEMPENCTFGDILQKARAQAGLKLEQVNSMTKLSMTYLRAMEHNDKDKLPPPVYVMAYVKTLVGLYRIDGETEAWLRSKLHDFTEEEEVSTQLIDNLDSSVNEEEQKKLRRFTITVVGSAAAILFLIIALILYFSFCFGGSGETAAYPAEDQVWEAQSPVGNPEFTREEFDNLTVPQLPEANTLNFSKKTGINRQ